MILFLILHLHYINNSILLFIVELIKVVQQHYFPVYYCITHTPIFISLVTSNVLRISPSSSQPPPPPRRRLIIYCCRLVTSTKSLACVRKNNHTKTALIFKRAAPCAWYLVLDLRHVDIFVYELYDYVRKS